MLAQLTPTCTKPHLIGTKSEPDSNKGLSVLQKRARSKWLSNKLAYELVKLNSPLARSYANTFYCNQILSQEGKKVIAKYCNNRWCHTCNRVRTGKLLNGYKPLLEKLPDLYFVTLTIPNVKEGMLSVTFTDMYNKFRAIKKRLQKQGIKLKGLRKSECTYNIDDDEYHPHLHCVISKKIDAEILKTEWLREYPDALHYLQKVQQCAPGYLNEMFKYSTKFVANKKDKKGREVPVKALDIIYRALRKKRIFQPMGIKKISEDVEELQAELYPELEKKTAGCINWYWDDNIGDWYDRFTGELLTGYNIPDSWRRIFEYKQQNTS